MPMKTAHPFVSPFPRVMSSSLSKFPLLHSLPNNNSTSHSHIIIISKVPQALVCRFPGYKNNLEPFASFANFHANFPVNLKVTGVPVDASDRQEYPVFAQESVEKLTQNILIPLYTGKKMSTLMVGDKISPLQIGFVQDALPELDRMYKMELKPTHAHGDTGMPVNNSSYEALDEITEAEGLKLKKEFQRRSDEFMDDLALKILKQNVVFFHNGESGLLDKVAGLAMIKDGAVRLWSFNAGLQATQEPRKHHSIYRMKAAMDEDVMLTDVKIVASLAEKTDTSVWVCGRNNAIQRAIIQTLKSEMRPKPTLQVRRLEPNPEELLKVIRCADLSQGTLDAADTMIQITGKEGLRKAGPRRFLVGNSAFLHFNDLPVMRKDDMMLVDPKEKDAAMRGVQGSDKYGRLRRAAVASGGAGKPAGGGAGTPADADDDEDDDKSQHGEDEDEDPLLVQEKSDVSGKVIFWYMELHQKITAELLWESNARVLVDFTPGAGLALKTALTMGVKCIAIGNNTDHVKLLTTLLREWIRKKIEEQNPRLTPPDLGSQINELKNPRLLKYEQQKKTKTTTTGAGSASDAPEPEAKRHKAAHNLDAMLAEIEPGRVPKEKKTPKKEKAEKSEATSEPQALPASANAGTPASETPASAKASPASASAGTPATETDASLTALLKQWAP